MFVILIVLSLKGNDITSSFTNIIEDPIIHSESDLTTATFDTAAYLTDLTTDYLWLLITICLFFFMLIIIGILFLNQRKQGYYPTYDLKPIHKTEKSEEDYYLSVMNAMKNELIDDVDYINQPLSSQLQYSENAYVPVTCNDKVMIYEMELSYHWYIPLDSVIQSNISNKYTLSNNLANLKQLSLISLN